MLCREFLQNLSLYVDDALGSSIRSICDEHLRECPLCREELTAVQTITSNLHKFKKPVEMPFDLTESLRQRVAIEVAARQETHQPKLTIPFWQKIWEKHLQPQLVPYAVGGMASILLFAMMFASLRSSILAFRGIQVEARRARLERERLLATIDNTPYEDRPTLLAADYAVRRLPVSAESPSLDPNSAFVALTSSLAKGAAKNEAIMVVADVFSNGIANISNVLEAPREADKLVELEKLLSEEPAFVPAALDRRPNNVRVVLLIQEVEVPTIGEVTVQNTQKNTKLKTQSARFHH